MTTPLNEQRVKVIDVLPDSLKVEGYRQGGCAHCEQKQSCAAGALASETDKRHQWQIPLSQLALSTGSHQPQFDVKAGDVKPGDEISLQCNESALLKVIATLFIPPLFGAVSGALLGEYGLALQPLSSSISTATSSLNSTSTIVMALAGGAIGGYLSRRWLANVQTPNVIVKRKIQSE
ncbi:SoxR reducing system RseC family protein [Corallincola platygyrae]|uniref:SoxR reducing system RseC family protein n=1 Tax=Corallincola platygyrae TaxID=1193278 RepID=A0ABW4XGC8_9GAMM